MKSFAQFIKETYHIQEKLDATVYGQVRYGAPPVVPKTKSQISNMVSKGIDDYKAGKPVQPPRSSSRDDLNSVTMHLQDEINNLIG